ncbi:MAG: TRAP transporter small permease [Limnochordia bacterium]|jgi:TRAP-type C4-dicarboxylate transport system permease small subunit
MLERLSQGLERCSLLALFLILSSVVGIVFVQVISRYVFFYSLPWSEEMARYLFVWMIMLGGNVGVKRRNHVRIDAIFSVISQKAAVGLEILTTLVLMVLFGFMTVNSVEMVSFALATNQLTPATQIPIGHVYLVFPIGSGCMLFQNVVVLLQQINTMRSYGREVTSGCPL